jgi:hypothetical protein
MRLLFIKMVWIKSNSFFYILKPRFKYHSLEKLIKYYPYHAKYNEWIRISFSLHKTILLLWDYFKISLLIKKAKSAHHKRRPYGRNLPTLVARVESVAISNHLKLYHRGPFCWKCVSVESQRVNWSAYINNPSLQSMPIDWLIFFFWGGGD